MTTTFTYNEANEPLTESYSGGTLSGLSVTNGYDLLMRRTNLVALNGSTILTKHTFGYDNASRLSTVTDNSGATPYSANYASLANSPLVTQIALKTNTTARLTVTKQYDYLNRLLSNFECSLRRFCFKF